MTVLEAIRKSREFLEARGIESARLESEWLLGHVLELPRLRLYLSFDRLLSAAETDRLRGLVKRRGAREPLQHILGTAVFCGLEIAVNRQVLIPRPETELLAEAGWSWLGGLSRPATFLDFGTGSGCIAIALCRNAPRARGMALDKSDGALAVARENARRNGVEERIAFCCSDGFAAVPGEKFDLIVSNPPYIPAGEIGSLQFEVREFDPHSALDGGADGLEFYRYLAAHAPAFLAEGGRLLAEFGDGQSDAVRTILVEAGWVEIAVHRDLTGRARFIGAAR